MMLTEPVQCSTCKAVSVNGGTIHCHGCYSQLESDNARLREAIEKAPDNSTLTGWPDAKRLEFEEWQREALEPQKP